MVSFIAIADPDVGGVLIHDLLSHPYLHIVLNLAFVPINTRYLEIQRTSSTSQLAVSLSTSQLSAVGNNSNERVSAIF